MSEILTLNYSSATPYKQLTLFSTQRNSTKNDSPYADFNICPYVGDSPSRITHNRQRLTQMLGISDEQLIVPYQVHGDAVHEITSLEQDDITADALITQLKNVCLTISTADCVPVFIYDPIQQAIGLVHAGWRGCVQRIVSKTISRMMERYQSKGADLVIVIGPCISLAQFEVGEEVVAAFADAGFDPQPELGAMPGKFYLDLPMLIKQEIEQLGVSPKSLESSDVCTYTSHEIYFSARRLGIRSGRICHVLMMQ